MAAEAEILAKKLFGSKKIKKIETAGSNFVKRYKVVVFVPPEKAEELIFALASAGAGTIGNYTLCSFRTSGSGTFKGNAESNPQIGTKEKFETAKEDRLEMACDKEDIDRVIDKLFEVHPYDEPAFEIYETFTRTRHHSRDIAIVTLNKRTTVQSLLKIINPAIDAGKVPAKMKTKKIQKCAVDCTGEHDIYQPAAGEKIFYIKKINNKLIAYLT